MTALLLTLRAGVALAASPAVLAASALPALAAAEVARTDDAAAALAAVLDDARGADAARLDGSRRRLETPAFLQTVDSPADYRAAARARLHVDQVVAVLAKNPAPAARAVFLALTASPTYLAHEERTVGLILASVHIRPAPPELVKFWDRHSRPGDGFTPSTIGALVENASAPALALLERKLADPSHRDGDKIGWMRADVLTHRNDPALLRMCGRLLSGRLKRSLRPRLAEVLFDYRPDEWYRPATTRSAPPLAAASPEARAELRKTAAVALRAGGLDPRQRAAIARRLKELDALEAGAP